MGTHPVYEHGRAHICTSDCPCERVFEQIVENAPVPIHIVRAPDFVYELVNPACQALAPGKQFLGRRVQDVWAQDSGPILAELEQVIATGQPRQSAGVPLVIERDGGNGPESIHASTIRIPLFDKSGKPDRVLTMATETTEAVRQRRLVEHTLARDEAIMANLEEGLLIADDSGKIISANRAALRAHGWATDAEAMRRPAEFAEFRAENMDGEAVPPEEWPISRVLRGETVRNVELAVTRLDTGETRINSYSGSPIRGADGRTAFAILTVRDITAQKEAERKLRDSERQLRELADSMPHLVWISLPDGFHVYFNRRWYEELGTDAEQSIGVRWEERLHPDDRERACGEWRRCLASGEDFHTEYRVRTAAGDYRWCLARAVPVRDAEGRIARWYGTCTDIHDRKLEEERRLQTQKLESIGLLAGGIAHDFNNLLTGIVGNASLALDERGADVEQRLRRILDAADRAAHLTRQLLAYSGRGKFVIAHLDLSQAVREVLDLLRVSVPKRTEIKLDLQDRLPPVCADPGQLQQVVMNLVINAGEAIGEGNPGVISIRTGVREIGPGFSGALADVIAPGRYAWMEVRDTGSGMSEEVRGRIFDPFFTTKFTGRGLGLAAVAGIMRSLKGTVDVSSAPGVGAVFTLFFPAGEALRAPATETRGTILVVDDDPEVRHFLSAALERAKFHVLSAGTGEEAIAVFKGAAADIDAVVVDLVIPAMCGRELIAAIRARKPEVKVLAMSGCDEAEARRVCQSLHGAAFLQKPFTARRLRQELDQLLESVR